MNKKIKTITSWLAAAIFLLALALNIKVTLDDPFVMLSDEAIAQTTETTGSSSSGTLACQTKSILGGQVFPCENGYEEGETWATMWCEGTGPEECLSGSYYWVLECDGTQVGSSEQRVSHCN